MIAGAYFTQWQFGRYKTVFLNSKCTYLLHEYLFLNEVDSHCLQLQCGWGSLQLRAHWMEMCWQAYCYYILNYGLLLGQSARYLQWCGKSRWYLLFALDGDWQVDNKRLRSSCRKNGKFITFYTARHQDSQGRRAKTYKIKGSIHVE